MTMKICHYPTEFILLSCPYKNIWNSHIHKNNKKTKKICPWIKWIQNFAIVIRAHNTFTYKCICLRKAVNKAVKKAYSKTNIKQLCNSCHISILQQHNKSYMKSQVMRSGVATSLKCVTHFQLLTFATCQRRHLHICIQMSMSMILIIA